MLFNIFLLGLCISSVYSEYDCYSCAGCTKVSELTKKCKTSMGCMTMVVGPVQFNHPDIGFVPQEGALKPPIYDLQHGVLCVQSFSDIVIRNCFENIGKSPDEIMNNCFESKENNGNVKHCSECHSSLCNKIPKVELIGFKFECYSCTGCDMVKSTTPLCKTNDGCFTFVLNPFNPLIFVLPTLPPGLKLMPGISAASTVKVSVVRSEKALVLRDCLENGPPGGVLDCLDYQERGLSYSCDSCTTHLCNRHTKDNKIHGPRYDIDPILFVGTVPLPKEDDIVYSSTPESRAGCEDIMPLRKLLAGTIGGLIALNWSI